MTPHQNEGSRKAGSQPRSESEREPVSPSAQSRILVRGYLIALAVLIGAAGSAQAREDTFAVAVGSDNDLLDGTGTGYADGKWYQYPSGWWAQWFLNAPFDPQRKKVIELRLDVEPLQPDMSCVVKIAYNWSTPQWSALGKDRPPLPGDKPESEYIKRYEFFDVQLPYTGEPTRVNHRYEIAEYNPEWVSIDVYGENFAITDGWIKHECVAKDGPVPTQACCLPDGECVNLTPEECKAKGGDPQGPGTQCLGDKDGDQVDDACEQQPTQCVPTADGQGCVQVACPDTSDICVPTKIRVSYRPGAPTSYTVLSCACQSPNLCHVQIDPPDNVYCVGGCPAGQQCDLQKTDNGDGTSDYECRCTEQPEPTEACCLPNGMCMDTTPAKCQEQGGQPQGENTVCLGDQNQNGVDDACEDEPTPETMACCLPDGTCRNLKPYDCLSRGGTLRGPGSECSVLGACCLSDGSCVMTDRTCCGEVGGAFQGLGTECSNVVCPQPKLPDLVITDVWEALEGVCYEIANVGQAPAPEGHTSVLLLDGEPVAVDLVDVELAPNDTLKRCFDYDWFGFDVMVDDAFTDTSHQGKPAVAVDVWGIIHVVWEDHRNGKGDIYYSNSKDGGRSFGEDVMVEDPITFTTHQANPAIAVDRQGIIHVVWEDYRNGPGDIFYSKSVDGGKTFEKDVMVDDPITATTLQFNPAIAVSEDGIIYVAFEDYRDHASKGNIFCSRSINGGETFERDVRVDDWVTDTSHQAKPAIAVDDLGIVHVAWEDHRHEPASIFHSKSTDGGKAFGKDVMVDDNISVTTRQVDPAIAVGKDGIIYVAFEDYRDDPDKGNIFCSRSLDGGESFEEDIMVDDAYTVTSQQRNPAIAVDGKGTVHVVWEDYRGQAESLANQWGTHVSGQSYGANLDLGNIYYSKSTDGGKTFGKDVMVDDFYTVTSQQIDPAIAVDDSAIVHVVWQDYRTNRLLPNIFYANSLGSCALPAERVTVCADSEDSVAESDEINNCVEETWICDTTPPRIIAGPTVSQIGRTSCVVSWVTDEDSDSTVKSGRYAGQYESEQGDTALTQEHEVVLTDLKPGTVYHYIVQSRDSSGNRASSKDHTFETLPTPDEQDPRVSIQDTGICKGIARIMALASDDLGVERVEFYVEDKLVFTAYSAPFECPLDTTEYANGDHDFKAKAFDFAGRMATTARVIEVGNRVPNFLGPSIEIITPDHGDTVAETVMVAARATDDEGMGRIEFYIDDELVHSRLSPSPEAESLYSSFFWDTYEVDNGTHHIRVTAYDAEENASQNTVTVTVDNISPRHRPDMIVRRKNMTFSGTKLAIRLDVHNAGDRSGRNVQIVDRLVGLQPTGWVHGAWDLTSEFDAGTKECEVTLSAPHAFNPGVGTDVLYDVVPILTEADILYQVGTSTSVSYDGVEGDHYDKELSIPSWVVDRPGDITWHLVATVDHAFSNANYLIATNPSRLFSHYVDDDVNALLCSMATLAEERTGVLGYLDTNNRTVIKGLIEPGGEWSGELRTGWTSNGYLLIVGETEIVPSRDVWDSGIRNATDHWTGGSVYPVGLCDNYYADVSGSDNLPDLIVARIIGDSANQLNTPIQTSLLDQFDRTDALVASGTGGGQDSFENNADDVADILDDEFTVNQMVGSDYASDAQRLAQFRIRAQDKDVMYYRDHGSVDCWSHTVCEWDFPVNFGTSRPFAFGNACSTGNFEQGGDYGAAEAFLDSGAGVYLGATEGSARSTNNTAGKKFFNNWVDSSISLGRAFKDTKRQLGTSNSYKRLWVLEYNLYGDPAYGAGAAVPGPVIPGQHVLQPPLSSLDLVVPDYEVKSKEGVDYVEIPDGELWLVADRPIVPFYVVSLDYAKGYEVQDVLLTERSGLVTATGLNLPIASMEPDGPGGDASALLGGPPGPEWYPQEEYDWQVIENPDGSTTLRIAVYPFYYNPLTTDVQFYQNYAFDIDWASSSVQITALATDKDVYEQEEQVQVALWLDNSGEAQDVIVSAVVKADSSGELVDGLLLRSLKSLQGPASFSCQWNSSGCKPGHYYVEAALKSTDGNILERDTRRFRLGICSGQITSFSATPQSARVGEDVTINMTFSNDGTVDITGSARIRVLNSGGDVIDEFEHPITDLPPIESVTFSDVWKVSQAGPCDILGYVSYDGGATDPVIVRINEAECFPSDYSTYGDFLEYKARGKDPNCWCAPPQGSAYQCDGDTDGKTSGFPFDYRVFTRDLALITNHWQKKIDDPTLDPCADVDHKDSGFPFYYRVFTGDLSILVANWKKTDSELPGDCPRPQ